MTTELLVTLATTISVAVVALAAYYFGFRSRTDATEVVIDQQQEIEKLRRRLDAERERPTEGVGAEKATTDAPRSVPDPPAGLVERCRQGKVMVVVGRGVAPEAGHPTWREFLWELAIGHGPADGDDPGRAALAAGDLELAGQLMADTTTTERLVAAVDDAYPAAGGRVGRWSEALSELPVNGAITTGWDRTTQAAFRRRSPHVVVPARGTDYAEALREDTFTLVHLYGSPSHARSELVWSAHGLRRLVVDHPDFERFFATLFDRWTLLFVGVAVDDIDALLAAFRVRHTPEPHYALVTREDTRAAAVTPATLRASYNVQTMEYDPGPVPGAVTDFLLMLTGQVGDWRTAEQLRDDAASQVEPGVLNSVTIENFGPFASLDLRLAKGWTMLVGVNGAGKTSLLRAVAAGLCGDDPQVAGLVEHYVREPPGEAQVTVVVRGVAYQTTITKSGITTRGFTPLREGRWAALGFPALRGTSLEAPSNRGRGPREPPSVRDVLPLLSYAPDSRLDDTKTWLYRLYVQATSDEFNASERAIARDIIDDYFALLDDVSPGMKISFEEVDLVTREVRVRTRDGVIGLDDLSQGITSVLGWVGILMQRMREIYPRANDPTKQPALVLIDEIDAHMHPEWQRSFVGLVRKRFPNLQVVATTHSSLVVAEMASDPTGASEVLVFGRDEAGNVTLEPPPYDWEGLSSDQILTSPIFGMRETQSTQIEQEIDEYAKLLSLKARDRLTPAQRERLEVLAQRMHRFSAAGQTATARRVETAVREVMKLMSDPDFAPAASPDETPDQLAMRMRYRLEQQLGPAVLGGHDQVE